MLSKLTNLPKRKILKNLEGKIAIIFLITFTCVSSPGSMVFFNHQITEASAVGINGKQIRGGGNGSITCPDSSSRQASMAFFVYQNNSERLPTGRWSINELSNSQSSSPGFVSGSFNSTEINSNTYTLIGKKIYEVALCPLPISVPVTINGQCGQHVTINVEFESSDPLVKTGGSFTGDVICSSS
jgi:hypothetical protein